MTAVVHPVEGERPSSGASGPIGGQPPGYPARFGFVMEQVLGHTTHYRTLRRLLDQEPGIEPHWIEVTYRGGASDSMPMLPPAVRGTIRGFQEVRAGLSQRKGFDALFFHTQKPAVFQWDVLARIPTVLSLDVTPAQYDELGEFYGHQPDRGGPVAALKRWMNRKTFTLARAVVVWSNWVTDSLVKDYAVPPEKVRVIPPGVDTELWVRPDVPRPGASPLPRVLFVGGDFARKGGGLLLEWFREQGRERCELDLVTGAEIPAEPGVRVHNDVTANSERARQLFFDADVFVLPSFGECFGIAAVEAMAAGLPIVMTDVGGSGDIVDHGQTGFLVPAQDKRALGEALDRLLSDSSLRQRMGRSARAKAESTFDAATNARALLSCLRDVAESRAGEHSNPIRSRTA